MTVIPSLRTWKEEDQDFKVAGWWWCMHMFNPTSWRQRQVDLCEFETNLEVEISGLVADSIVS